MANLTDNRDIKFRLTNDEVDYTRQAKDSTSFYKGGLVSIATGIFQPVQGSGTQKVVGVSQEQFTTGVGNTRQLRVKSGIFGPFDNGDSLAASDCGIDVFAGDDHTIFKSSAGGKPFAGTLFEVDAASKVWISVSTPFSPGKGATGT